MGGYTHANYMYVGMIMENVASIDFTSSYPSVMIRKKYPMQPFTKIHIKDLNDFRYCIKNYPCVFEVELTNVIAKNVITFYQGQNALYVIMPLLITAELCQQIEYLHISQILTLRTLNNFILMNICQSVNFIHLVTAICLNKL